VFYLMDRLGFSGLERKGAIAQGMDADLAIIDTDREVEIRSEDQVGASRYILYHGEKVRGWPVQTFLRGQLLLGGQILQQKSGYGRFVSRRPCVTRPCSVDLT
jgi:dihydropyrimidinase